MTNPPPPAAPPEPKSERLGSAMGLVAEWKGAVVPHEGESHQYMQGCIRTKRDCADELAAALSLSEDEREALARMDEAGLTYGGSLSIDKRPLYSMIVTIADYDTIRALIARFTNIGEVK